jgi:hypothetical protein
MTEQRDEAALEIRRCDRPGFVGQPHKPMRRPRAGFVTPHPGGSGTPLGGHDDPSARSFAGQAAPVVGGRTQARQGDEPNWRRGPEADRGVFLETRDRKQKSPQVERREAPAFLLERGTIVTDAPFGAPLPLMTRASKACPREGGEDDGVPGAAKNRGDGARVVCTRSSGEGTGRKMFVTFPPEHCRVFHLLT